VVSRVIGLEIAADSLKGRVFEVSLADLNRDSNEQAWRKMKVQVEEVKGFDCYTNFYGMDVTRDKLCTIVKKWHTTVEAFVQTKTLDGYLLRMFCIGFTKRTSRQVRATCYAKGSQRKLIRKKMMEIMINEAQKSTLKELTKKLYVSLSLIYFPPRSLINYIFAIASRTPWASRSRRSARRSSLFRTCSSARSSCSRSPSSI
jgi:small subunit ribosomal protein S3Ae